MNLSTIVDKYINYIIENQENSASVSAGLPGFDLPSKKKNNIIRQYENQNELDNREMKRIMIDFDGVIHSYDKGWQNGEIYGDVIEGAKETIDELSKDHQIVIFTTRVSEGHNAEMGRNYNESIKDVENWLNEHDIYFDFITADKLPAIAYIDDKAIEFKNNWKDIKEKINNLN